MSDARVTRAGSGDAGFMTEDQHSADVDDITLVGALTATADGEGDAVDLGDRGTMCLSLSVSAASGTLPTLDVEVQTSLDKGNADPWRSIGTFPQRTGTGSIRASFAGCDRYVRAVYDIAGTLPSFTFTVSGQAR